MSVAVQFFREAPAMEADEHLTAAEVIAKEGPKFTMRGKTALVTGGSSGLGVETVRALASAGAKVLFSHSYSCVPHVYATTKIHIYETEKILLLR